MPPVVTVAQAPLSMRLGLVVGEPSQIGGKHRKVVRADQIILCICPWVSHHVNQANTSLVIVRIQPRVMPLIKAIIMGIWARGKGPPSRAAVPPLPGPRCQ